MNTLQLDAGLESEVEQRTISQQDRAGVGILIQEPVSRRLVETLTTQLELVPTLLEQNCSNSEYIRSFELIIADEPAAIQLRSLLATREEASDGVNPALVAVMAGGSGPLHRLDKFEGVLMLPQKPATVLAQLSVILYAHRAFVRRYHSALEELHLNRRIFRSVSSSISVADATLPDMPLVYVNPAFEVMTGYSLEEVQGKNCRFLQRGERNQPGLTLIREALEVNREVVVILKNYRKDGTSFWNELSLSPIRSRDGELTHFVGIQNDVTARMELESALRESEKLAAVGRLAASIAHEINNPLEAVTNLLYLARHADDASEMKRYLELADQELRRASLITSQSLRFYKQSTRPSAIRPAEMLEGVLDLYQGKLDNAAISVERRERKTQSIVCLESEIRQVLSNLVRNAIDAMNGSGGRLLVRTRDTTEWRTARKGVMITIADTGSGISREAMQHLYTAFFTTKGIKGTGLGLWVSSEILKRHQGRLRVRSSQRPGSSWTVFEVFLPYQGLTS